MSFDPGSIISLIQTCQTLYDYFKDVNQSSVERRRLLDEVVSLQSVLEALQRLVDVGDPASTEQLAQLLGPSQPFYEALRETLTHVEAVLRNGVPKPRANRWKVLWRRLVAALSWTAEKAEVKTLLSDVERHKSRIMIALQHDMFKKQDGIDDKLKDHIDNGDRLRIAHFISQHDFSGHRKELLEKILSGTGTWMTHHPTFVAWRDNRESPRTLWCYGHPGAGKSVMAALIIEHFQSTPGNVVLSVFCRYSSNIFTTPFAVLSGLLRQLIEKTKKVPRAVCDLYWNQTDPKPDALPGFLAEIAASLVRPIYIVIDALDECPFGLDLLGALQKLDSSFRVLITSRPVFKEIEEHPSIKIRASDHDILIAVDTALSKLKHAWLDEELKRTIRAQVVKKADGMFLLASLQLRELEWDVTCRHDVADILDSLPDTLDDAYKLTFQRIRGQRKRSNILACRALALIPLHSQSLKIEHLQHLLAEGDTAQYPDIETVLRCCHGLVHMGSPTKLAFIHYSVHEYTIMHWSELFPEHPNRIDFCLNLGLSTLRSLPPTNLNMMSWDALVSSMGEPEELSQVITFLFTSEARASFTELYAEHLRWQRSLIEKTSPGTGTWVLRHPIFVAWRDDRESPRTVWYHEHLDLEKSILGALVVDHLQSRGDIVLSIFCGHSLDTTCTTAPAALLGLLRQLIEKSPNQSQAHPNLGTLPLYLTHLATSHERPIYIVIDALDECPFGSYLLRALRQLDSSFRILVTLRPVFEDIHGYSMTKRRFSDSFFNLKRVLKEIHQHSPSEVMTKIYAADEDILAAVDTTLQELKQAWLDEELKSTIRVQVVLRANGISDFASLLLRELKRNITSRCDVPAILDSLPRTLDDAYKLTFQRIRKQGGRSNELACRTLAMAASRTSLDFTTVQHLLAEGNKTQYTDIETILQCCHGLLDVSRCCFIDDSAYKYTTAHWSELFPETPNPVNICLQLALSTMANKMSSSNDMLWYDLVCKMTQDDEQPQTLDQVISFLSTSTVRELLVQYRTELVHFVHDPFLIACYFGHERVVEYMINTAPPDLQRFSDALHLLNSHNRSSGLRYCINYINTRHDMGVTSDGVVVALDPEHGGSKPAAYCLKIAKFISGSDLTGSHKRGLLQEKLKNTGTWLMQDPRFVAWRDDRESPRTLWCYGHPGAGKSVIAASIVDHLQSMDNIVLSIFCRYSSSTFTTPYPVLCDLLGQLIGKSLKILPAICDLYQSQAHPNPDTLPGFLSKIATSQARPIYIVIDALDECQIALELLREIQQLGPSFRALVTSCPIFPEIHEAPSIQIRASADDILVAVETTLSRLDHAWLDEELKNIIRAQVVDKADGIFLLASLQLRELERDVTCRRDVRATLASLPHTLDDAYKLTFQRIREQDGRKSELACRALALLVLHSPVLETKHLQHLLAEGDVALYLDIETIMQCCDGLVHRRSYSELPVFIHHSAHEYITMHWSELFPEHPNRIDFCLNLGLSTLRSLPPNNLSMMSWEALVSSMGKPEELSQVIPFLFTADARASFTELYAEHLRLKRSLIEKISPGTGTWVLQHLIFVTWRDDKESPRTLWCDGDPSVGKSVLTALVVDHLQSRGDIVLSIFCGHSLDTTCTTTSAALLGLLRQLIEMSPNQSQTHPNLGTLPVYLTHLATSHERPIYIVIDGLDECPFGFDLLPAFQYLDSSFRILVTLKPVFEDIHGHSTTKGRFLDSLFTSNTVFNRIHGPSSKIHVADNSILNAVDTTLQKLRHAWLDEELKSTIRVKVVEKADGFFILASLQLRELERNATSRRDVLATLDSLPRTLDDAYKLTFQRIRDQGQRSNELACRTLAIAASRTRSMSFTTVQHLLAKGDKTQYTDIETILQCCHGLLDVSRFTFIDRSARQYTIDHWSELFPENPNPVNLCLQLALSAMTNKRSSLYDISWYDVVREMTHNDAQLEKLDQVISFLSTSTARELLVEYRTELVHFVHDPFLISCYFGHEHVVKYMIQTAPPDLQRLNDALHLLKSHNRSSGLRYCIASINARRDLQVNSDGVVVALDSNGGEKA